MCLFDLSSDLAAGFRLSAFSEKCGKRYVELYFAFLAECEMRKRYEILFSVFCNTESEKNELTVYTRAHPQSRDTRSVIYSKLQTHPP